MLFWDSSEVDFVTYPYNTQLAEVYVFVWSRVTQKTNNNNKHGKTTGRKQQIYFCNERNTRISFYVRNRKSSAVIYL